MLVFRTDRQSSRSSKWVNASGLVSGGLDNSSRTPVSQGAKPNTQINPVEQPVDLSNDYAITSESVVLPSLARQIEPQQWIKSVNIDWDQWDLIMASLGTTS